MLKLTNSVLFKRLRPFCCAGGYVIMGNTKKAAAYLRGARPPKKSVRRNRENRMAEIKPFRAVHFTDRAGNLDDLVCPGGFLSEKQRAAFLSRSPYHASHLILPDGTTAEKTMRAWLEEGILVRDMDPGFYLWEDKSAENGIAWKRKGLICLAGSGELHHGTVCPSSMFYPDEARITAARLEMLASGRPRCGFSDGKIQRRIWLINDREMICALCADFESRRLIPAHPQESGDGEKEALMTALVSLEEPGIREAIEAGKAISPDVAGSFPEPVSGFIMALPD